MAIQANRSQALDALDASGPYPDWADKQALFGQFVGSWNIEATHFDRDGSVARTAEAEWLFGWILEGRGIQDVLIVPPRSQLRSSGAPVREYGTTVRIYDPGLDAWRMTWFAPVEGAAVSLLARESDDGIVIEGRNPTNGLYRWTFTEITTDSFVWSGYESDDEAKSWFLGEVMHASRISTA